MSEQTKQSKEFSKPTYLGEWVVYDIGSTTVSDLFREGKINKHTNNPKVLSKKPDALIVSQDKEILVFVESKDDGKLNTEKQINAAIEQELFVAQETKAKIFVVRDSSKTIWINPLTGNRIKNEHDNFLMADISPVNKPKETEKIIKKVLSSISATNDALLSDEVLNPTDLARQIHQKLFISKGVSPSTALYTFVEMFLFKYLSDLKVLSGKYSFEYLLGLYTIDGISEVDVLKEYLSDNGARSKMKELFPVGNHDDTTIINGNIFHENVGDANTFRNIMDSFKQYEMTHGKLTNISKDFKSKLFESFLKQDSDSKNMGQFFTPLKIVDNMIRMVDIKEGMSICDPACGVGKFLLEAISDKINDFYSYENGQIKKKIELTGYDKYSEDNGDKTIILAKANTLIYFSKLLTTNPSSNFAKALAKDVLNEVFTLKNNTLGTLEKIEYNKYDLILANPPYIVNGSGDVKRMATEFSWGGLGIESLFMEWIVKALKPDGIANVVIPDGLLSNINNKKLKENIKKYCYIESVISLPIKSFFNTPKKTYIITLRKKRLNSDGDYPEQDYPIFTYICKSVGETLDVYRFDTDDNDLENAVNAYNIYRHLSEKDNIEGISLLSKDNLHFKKIKPEAFAPEKSWIIENWWRDEEKIALGLKEKQTELTIDDFQNLIDETISVMSSFKEVLESIK